MEGRCFPRVPREGESTLSGSPVFSWSCDLTVGVARWSCDLIVDRHVMSGPSLFYWERGSVHVFSMRARDYPQLSVREATRAVNGDNLCPQVNQWLVLLAEADDEESDEED